MKRDRVLTYAEPFLIPTDLSPPNLILIGTNAQLPNCLCKVLQSEIDGTQVVRLASLAEFTKALKEKQVQPQLVIIDHSLWRAVDEPLLDRMRLEFGAIVAIAFRNCAQLMQSFIHNQPSGPISFLPMDLNMKSWLTIVQLLFTGYPFVPPEVVKALGGGTAAGPADSHAHSTHPDHKGDSAPNPSARADRLGPKLTRREAEVLRLMARGLQNKHIAEHLDLSEHTIKLHVHNVIFKLGAINRTDAAIRFHQQTKADGYVR